jgi:hypothetical protein
MLSIWCQEGSYFNNFVQKVETLCNSSILFVQSMHFESPLFYGHCNYESNVIVIPSAMRTCQGDPLGRALFTLAHFTALCYTISGFLFYLFPSNVNDIHMISSLSIVSFAYEHF